MAFIGDEPITPIQGGTGVINAASSTITLSGAFSTTGPYTLNLNTVGNTNVTFPTSGTLITSSNEPLWTSISASQTAVVGVGYFCTGGSPISLALPPTSSLGDQFIVCLAGASSFTITQAALQQIQLGAYMTSAGTSGSLVSSAQGDYIRMVCFTPNLKWYVIGCEGNLTLN